MGPESGAGAHPETRREIVTRIAVVGSGISGVTAAWVLSREHDVTLFEADSRLGVHTYTVDVWDEAVSLEVYTGFIVFNFWTYPNFIRFLHQLGVAYQKSDMSFSLKCDRTGLEYNGTTLNSLFAQRSNIVSPRFLSMVKDILKFNREGRGLLKENLDDETSLEEFLSKKGYGRPFIEDFIVPIGAAIWSSPPGEFARIPLRFFLRFSHNHGMLSVGQRPQWMVVKGGSREYLRAFEKKFRGAIRLNSPVSEIRRAEKSVSLVTPENGRERFDFLVMACHSNQSLAALSDPSPPEKEVLGAIRYQANDTTLHTDSAVLPKRPLAWAAWNYHRSRHEVPLLSATYNMNILQSLKSRKTYCVTLNEGQEIRPSEVLRKINYEHPQFDLPAVKAQKRKSEINGVNRTWFCGAYWGYGFHEDGVKSALDVCRDFQLSL